MYFAKNLEIHIVDHCNLDCIGCSHESPLVPNWFESPNKLKRDLSLLWNWYQAPLIKLLGGEPLLHPKISEIISIVKMMTQSRVRVVTNGILLKKQFKRLYGIDEIHISVYPNTIIHSNDDLIQIAAELSVPVTIQRFKFFRWHRSPPRNNLNMTKRIFNTCQIYHSWQCHTLRDGWLYPCPTSATWARGNKEGILLRNSNCELQKERSQLLSSKNPFNSCKECLGSVGKRYEHRLGWCRKLNTFPDSKPVDSDFLLCLESNPDSHNRCYTYERTILPTGEIYFYKESR